MSSTNSTQKKKIKRSRFGCHRCKKLKSKCSEEKPSCSSCLKMGVKCDYSLKLMWGGRPYKNIEKRQNNQFVSDVFQEVGTNVQTGPIKIVPTFFAHNQKSVVKKEKPDSNQEIQVKLEIPNELYSTESLQPSSSVNSLTLSTTDDSVTSEPSIIRQSSGLFSPLKQEDLHYHPSPTGSDSRLSDLADVCTNFAEDFEKANMIVGQDFLGSTSWPNQSVETPISPDFEKISDLPLYPQNEGHNDEVQALQTLTSIPPLLMPLPELLLQVPYYRQLFHFFVDVASNNLVPAPSLYIDNPFKVLLPQMAMEYSGVLTSILAFAARAMQTLNNSHDNDELIGQLLGRSCSELLKQLEDKSEATSDGTLATILLLLSYEVVHSENFDKHRTHTYGAGQIVLARRKKLLALNDTSISHSDSENSSSSLSSKSHEESNIAYFLMRWFAYVDVIGALSSTKGRDKYLRSYRGRGEYSPVDKVTCWELELIGDPSREIDYLLGFDVRLFPHFVNIVLLLDEVDIYLNEPSNDRLCLPQNLIAAALELKESLTKDHESAEEKRQVLVDEIIETNIKAGSRAALVHHQKINDIVTKDNILRCTNRLFYYLGLLNLYRRVLLIPRELSLVQDLVTKMVDILRNCIVPGSPAEICTIFCNFCCGCEVIESDMKMFFVDRFTRLAQEGVANATKSLTIMGRCWETGEDWITAANLLSIDLVLM